VAEKQAFSIAVSGSGLLMGMLFAELTRRFPEATVYDRSAATNALRRGEVELGERGLLRPEDRAWARRVARSLASPPPVDITVEFSSSRKSGPDRVAISNGHRTERLKFYVKNAKSIAQLDSYVRSVVRMIQSLL
jgi:hypothetical protein